MKKKIETKGRKRNIMRKGRSGGIERWKPRWYEKIGRTSN